MNYPEIPPLFRKIAEDRNIPLATAVANALGLVGEPHFSGKDDPRRLPKSIRADSLPTKVAYAIAGAVPGAYPVAIKSKHYTFLFWTVDGVTLSGCTLYMQSFGICKTIPVTDQYLDYFPNIRKVVGLARSAPFNYLGFQEILFHYTEAHALAPTVVGVYSKTLPTFDAHRYSMLFDVGANSNECTMITRLCNEVYDFEYALEKGVK